MIFTHYVNEFKFKEYIKVAEASRITDVQAYDCKPDRFPLPTPVYAGYFYPTYMFSYERFLNLQTKDRDHK